MPEAMVYDPKTQSWKKSDSVTSTESNEDNTNTGGSDDVSGLADSTSENKSATSKATQKANKKTLRTLEGNLVYVPNENTIQIKPRDTIELKGLGNYLSGKYYVETVERTISSSGYSQSATVIKTNFRKSLKIVAKYPDEKSKLKDFGSIYQKNLETYKSTHKGATPKSHTVKKNETLYTISKKYFNTSKYASVLAKINGNLPKNKWTKLPVGYKLIIAKK